MMKQTFEEKVKSMSAKEIIMSMVDGLINPSVMVNMSIYGDSSDGVCYGCAATNAVCRISGITFDGNNIDFRDYRAKAIDTDEAFLEFFECAIDCLRHGNLYVYNINAKLGGFVQIKNPNNIILPKLTTENYKDNLQPYIDLANSQVDN